MKFGWSSDEGFSSSSVGAEGSVASGRESGDVGFDTDIAPGASSAGTMMLSNPAGLALGAAALGTNAYFAYKQNELNKKAYELNKQNLDWTKESYANSLIREDTAVQRRAADLEAAGLSKTLAAGSAATTQSASNVNRLDAPQVSNPVSAAIGGASQLLGVLQQKQDYSRTVAETNLVKQQILNAQTENMRNLAETDLTRTRTRTSELDNAFKEFNNGILTDRWSYEQKRYENELALGESTRTRNSWLNKLEAQKFALDKNKFQLEKDRYNLDTFRYHDWSTNLFERLQMDRTMNQAKMDLMSQQALLSEAHRNQINWDTSVSRNAGVATKGNSPVGSLMRDIDSTLLNAFRGIFGR